MMDHKCDFAQKTKKKNKFFMPLSKIEKNIYAHVGRQSNKLSAQERKKNRFQQTNVLF